MVSNLAAFLLCGVDPHVFFSAGFLSGGVTRRKNYSEVNFFKSLLSAEDADTLLDMATSPDQIRACMNAFVTGKHYTRNY